jgi:BMFP domain-containing protein YqiC
MNDNNFSDIPALGDTQGLENFLNNQNLQAQGLQPVEEQPTEQPAANPAQPAAQSAAAPASNNVTREDLTNILKKLDEINARTNPQAQTQPAAAQPTPAARQPFTYTDQERNFVVNAMQRGYSLDQINQVIMQRRMQNGYAPQQNNALEQRMQNLEQYLRTQEYKQAEAAFVDKLSAFGDKFGLSEQDLVTFGNAALSKGINIAMPNVDLETAFRAIYPEQYAIRIQRMTPTNTSQIYGGTSIPEGNRASAAKAEDAYVEAFLKQTMPNQYGMLNKK